MRAPLLSAVVASVLTCLAMHFTLYTERASAHTPAANGNNCAGPGRSCTGSSFSGKVFRGSGDSSNRAFFMADHGDKFCLTSTCERYLQNRVTDLGGLSWGDSGFGMRFETQSGTNAIFLANSGARIDMGSGANDYMFSTSGGSISSEGGWGLGTIETAAGFGMSKSGSDMYLTVPQNYTMWLRQANGDVFMKMNATESRSVTGYLAFDKEGAGAPAAADCNEAAEKNRMYRDTTNHRLYICAGATRGWDYTALTD